ncbi:ATP-binding protein [Actinokineospora soli]|uniref:ATP-binding protein n=1 Tax=Actinokineospora soli TaxID=1048753 RepID=A0ABW2TPL9_9PSEU
MVNDPLLGGAGGSTDPAELLTPSDGKRARISVVSLIGLPTEEQRQGFVSQLQLEVFAWAKRNPAVDRPLGGLIVMDEAQTIAPSGAWTASTQSTILLASQARKYGLGLLLATQAPKGVHNQVTGNATTQFFGRLNSPAQIAAATELARAKGSDIGDISKLDRGQFYATGDGFGFRALRAPMCLSHHPPSPLRLEEVLDRARER